MFVSLALILLITLSGSVLTYLYSEEEKSLVRLCAGNIIGSAIFSLVGFLIACAFGLNANTVLLSLLFTLLPVALLIKKDWREKVFSSFKAFPEINLKVLLSVGFYIAVFTLLYFFFERAMIETKDGVFTGGSQNLGDLPFHLGAIFSFTEGQNFPPENPSFAFAKFTYPFMTDFVTAAFVALGAKVRDAMLWQNITLGFSLVVLFENFVFSLTKNKLAGKLAPIILLLSGGLGFINFFQDFWQDGRGFFEFLWHLPDDYTIRPEGIRWGNSLTTLFITQRSFLFGLPVTLIILTFLWKIFHLNKQRREEEIHRNEGDTTDKKTFSVFRFPFSAVLVGLLAGTLPLIHVHSLVVLFLVSAFLFFFSIDKWRVWLAFGLSVGVIAVPELVWALTGSATHLSKFIDWHFGWDAQGENIFVFWTRNLGLFIPLLILGIYFSQRRKVTKERIETQRRGDAEKDINTRPKTENRENQLPITNYQLLIFYIPFAMCFIIPNLVKLAPWEWDNIKVLIYWFVGSIPFVAWFLVLLWEKGKLFKALAAACLFVLTISGALDIWRVVSRQINYQVFHKDAVKIAEQIKAKTLPRSLFLNAPTYNSAVVLSGRRSLMRYSGNLFSYGIDYEPREREVKRIYEGTDKTENLLQKYGIEYVLISPEEKNNLTVNEDFFQRFSVIAEVGEYKIYQVKK